VRRPFALRTEVAGRLHDACAEELLPETIHDDAGRKRVVGTHKPIGKIEAIGRFALC
jgi:hypothetical protein